MAMIVDKITNLLNEKIYIGQTKQPIERRFIQHSKANRQPAIIYQMVAQVFDFLQI